MYNHSETRPMSTSDWQLEFWWDWDGYKLQEIETLHGFIPFLSRPVWWEN